MKHTPGPWGITCSNTEQYSSLNIGIEAQTGECFTICDMCDDGYDDETQNANANLISAAPDLLNALEKMLSRFQYTNKGAIRAEYVRGLAREAIKKAKGL